ncbi:MAG: hypothetical protein LBF88_07860 [Planctomycetaceae bacterium]|jgi:hypothetical protein|nr:hypothetical protein [Planctomycetaceae bacterium]
MIRTKPQEGLKLIKEEGQVSFQYAKKEPRPAFVFQIDKPTEESVRFVTVVIPYENGQIPKVSTILPEW